jgi:Domain of unknown function (DUF4270)
MNKFFGLLFATTLILIIPSCKEKTILGTNVIPAIDNINTFFTDTISIVGFNKVFDSTVSSRYISTNAYAPLGCISGSTIGDPIFGKTYASIALQLRQPNLGFKLPENVVIDSMILSIPHFRSYGDTIVGGNQTFNVYRMASGYNFSKDSLYYIHQSLPYDAANLLGSATINLKKVDSAVINAVKLAPQIRFRLDTNFARQILSQDTSKYNTYKQFVEWFRGLYITPNDTTNGNMLGYFQYDAAKLQIFTRTINATPDTTIYNYTFDANNCAHQICLNRNYVENSPLIKDFLHTTNPKGDSLFFVQSEGGNSVVLNFPTLGNIPNCIVNKAELEFTVIGDANSALKDTLFRAVSLIRASGINSSGVDYLLKNDYQETSSGIQKIVNDGFKLVEIESGVKYTKYRLTLTKTIQEAISTRNNNLQIRIIGLNGLIGSGRSLLGGTNRISQRAKFNLIYTKIK